MDTYKMKCHTIHYIFKYLKKFFASFLHVLQ